MFNSLLETVKVAAEAPNVVPNGAVISGLASVMRGRVLSLIPAADDKVNRHANKVMQRQIEEHREAHRVQANREFAKRVTDPNSEPLDLGRLLNSSSS